MNSSSVASSSANPARQGEKRKREREPQPPPQNLNNGSATRARIVEILASTANGCLSELGYYPGMPDRLKNLEKQNEKWREENVKLYQDNQRLVELTRNHSTTLSLSQIPDLDKLQRITELETQVNKLISENEELRKVVPMYGKLQQDHAKLLALYRIAYEEVHRQNEVLRTVGLHHQPFATQTTLVPHGQQTAYAPHQAQPLPVPNSQRSAMSVPQIQTQQHQYAAQVRQAQGQQQTVPSPIGISPQARQGQQQMVSSPVGISPPQPQVRQGQGQQQMVPSPVATSPSQPPFTQQIPGRRTDLIQTQTAVMQNYRQNPNSNPGSRRSSLNIVSPSMYESPAQAGHPPFNPGPQVQQQPPHAPNHVATRQDTILPNGVREIRRASYPSPLNLHAPNGYPDPAPQAAQAYQNMEGSNTSALYPYTPIGNPYPVFEAAPERAHSNPVPLPPPRTGSAPIPTISAQSSNLPPPPLSASRILAQSSLFAPPPPLVPLDVVSSTSPTQPAQPVQPMTISPRDTYINPPSTTQAPATSGATASHPLSLLHGHPPEAPVQDAGQGQTSGPVPYPYPMPYPPVGTPSAVNGMPSVPPAVPPSVNHETPSVSGEHTVTSVEGSHQLPESTHVAEGGPEQHMHAPSHSTEQAPSISAEQPPPNAEASVPEDENVMQVDTAEGEESEEEVELGPDGLRLVRDCLDQLFGEPVDGKVVCKLCEHRYNKNIVTEPPVPFVNATDEQLEAHCIDEHEYAWQELRTP